MFDGDTDATLLSFGLSPQAVGNSMKDSPSAQIPYRVDNLDSSSGVVTVTLTWQQEET